MSDLDLDELRSELEDFAQPEKKGGRSPREERVIAGFEDIQRFVETHGRVPKHSEDGDIFERLYAVRLDRLRSLDDCRSLLVPFDHQGLLTEALSAPIASAEKMDEDELLAELEGAAGSSDITHLRHVRSNVEKREAEEIATRDRCLDFDAFKPLFEQVQNDLINGTRSTRPFVKDAGFSKAEIKAGQFFILGGQTAFVASVGDLIKAPNGETDARLRVIYSNGTESDLLLRSLQRALYKDDSGRRITEPTAGPLFADNEEDGDQASGTIYVLRSKSNHPIVAAHREILHKIGVTSGSVEKRIANPRLDPTFLMADVELVATYKLSNINRAKLEHLIHKVFNISRIEIEIKDRFGKPVVPREWFLVPLFIIDEAIEKIRDGSIMSYRYDLKSASMVPT